jgi:Flp pilus assembly protein TadG
MALLMPWYIFLFVGAFDWGFFAHGLISTASAARVAALYTSANSTTTASNSTNDTATCTLALEELRFAANDLSTLTTCTALPVIVTYSAVTGADSQNATSVTVQYQTLQLIPIPGMLGSRFTFTRTVQMRLRT